MDINYCPPGGKAAARDAMLTKGGPNAVIPAHSAKPLTGERDWIHANSVSYDPIRDQVAVSFNVPCEFVIVDHSTSMEEAAGHTGGKQGQGGDILYRFGNPQTCRLGTRMEQSLFCQHSVQFVRGVIGDAAGSSKGSGNILLFNNGRAPDRKFSTVDEYRLPEGGAVHSAKKRKTDAGAEADSGEEADSGVYSREEGKPFGAELVWRHGPTAGRQGSFYCTHISGCQRQPNGNTLVTLGPMGTVFEVTPEGEEVWRYISPVVHYDQGAAVAFVRQGDQRREGLDRASLFRVIKYPVNFPGLTGKDLTPGRYLEA
jgi:hypothetical protein